MLTRSCKTTTIPNGYMMTTARSETQTKIHTYPLATAAPGVNSRHIGFLATGAQCDILLNCAL